MRQMRAGTLASHRSNVVGRLILIVYRRFDLPEVRTPERPSWFTYDVCPGGTIWELDEMACAGPLQC